MHNVFATDFCDTHYAARYLGAVSEIAERLKRARELAGYSKAKDAIEAFGFTAASYYQHEGGQRTPLRDTLERYSRAYRVNYSWLLTGEGKPRNEKRTVPVVGLVGAKAEIYSIDDHEKGAGLEVVDAPPGVAEGTVCVVVRGESMVPQYRDGTRIFYSQHLPPEECLYDQNGAVVRLADGRMMLKRILPGTRPGLFTLASVNADDLIDQELEWAAPIDWIKPARR